MIFLKLPNLDKRIYQLLDVNIIGTLKFAIW